jgi:hypothetical protein
MTQAAQAHPPQSAATPSRRPPAWTGPLVAGLCFGLAYGLTQRIVSLNVSELIRFGQGFDVQAFPGTSLESLRLRFGAAESELRGNLELNELERQKAASQTEEDKPGLTTQQEQGLPEPSAGNAAGPSDSFGSGQRARRPCPFGRGTAGSRPAARSICAVCTVGTATVGTAVGGFQALICHSLASTLRGLP